MLIIYSCIAPDNLKSLKQTGIALILQTNKAKYLNNVTESWFPMNKQLKEELHCTQDGQPFFPSCTSVKPLPTSKTSAIKATMNPSRVFTF